MWLSLVERYVRDVEVASSNLVTSTKHKKEPLRFLFVFACVVVFRLGCEATQVRLPRAGRVELARKLQAG